MRRRTATELLLALAAGTIASLCACSSNEITGQVTQASALVDRTRPEDGEIDASVDSTIYVVFRDPIDSETRQLVSLVIEDDGEPLPGTVVVDSLRATFKPDAQLELKATYRCAISTGVRLVAGQLERRYYHWSFETEDSLPPPPGQGP